MIWTALSVLVCLALAIKLVFFSYDVRCQSRLFYRAVLLVAAVYAFHQVVNFLYTPGYQVSPWEALFHMALFIGAFFIKPYMLPGNRTRCSDHRDVHLQERRHHDA